MAPLTSFFTLALLAFEGVTAHPGHDVFTEAAEKANFFKLKPRTIRDCAAHLEQRGVIEAAVRRRYDLASTLRSKRGITHKRMLARRDFSDYQFSHKYTNSSITLDTDEASIFADNSSCTLQTDVTQGPYYVNGELIRSDVTDGQDGIPIYVDLQIIDTSTCEPVSGVYMDFWHANATGVYSGVVANGNGDSSDTSNLDSTAMRGIQQTDDDGLVQFQSVFPGHYDGRATHIHIMTHNADATTLAENGTLLTGDDTTHASHVGQLFFDQDLITQVSQLSPYSSITASITENSADSILAQEADTTDPFVEYTLLGNDLSDGILMWMSIGIDPTKDSTVQSASTYYESGGISNGDSMGSPDGSGGAPNGTMGGSPPNGSGTGSANMTASGSVLSGTATSIGSAATSTATSDDSDSGSDNVDSSTADYASTATTASDDTDTTSTAASEDGNDGSESSTDAATYATTTSYTSASTTSLASSTYTGAAPHDSVKDANSGSTMALVALVAGFMFW